MKPASIHRGDRVRVFWPQRASEYGRVIAVHGDRVTVQFDSGQTGAVRPSGVLVVGKGQRGS
jgi:hypothetical protein